LQRRSLRSLAALVLTVGSVQGWAKEADWGIEQQDPVWVPFIPHLRYLKTDTEFEQSHYGSTVANGSQTDYRRIYFAPAFGVGWDYFVYHPDLLTFSLLVEPGYSWNQVEGSGYGSNQKTFLLNGTFNGVLLREKPYLTTINYTRAHDDVQFDFYNSAVTDTENMGVVTGYREGPVPVSLSFQKSNSDSVGYNQETLNDQLIFDLRAHNERKKLDATDLTYQFNQFDYQNLYKLTSSTTDSIYHHATLTDVEHFNRSTLNSSVLFYDISSTRSASDNLNASVGYNLEHTPHLHSFYNYTFSDYTANGSDSLQNYGTVGLGHQLYESLSSGINIHGSQINSSSFGSTLDSTTIGVGESEDYTKRLGEWGRLSLGNSLTYDLTDQQTAGAEQLIPSESYLVPITGNFPLKNGRAVSVQAVYYVVGANKIPLDGVAAIPDYSIDKTTIPWIVRINPLGPGPNSVPISSGTVQVEVSYIVLSNPSGSYSVFSDGAHISLRFWHDRAEIYANYNFTINQASASDFVLQDVQTFEAGAGYEWGGFRLHGSYTDQHSTLYNYQCLTSAEGYTTPLSPHSTVGLDLNQQWTIYPPGNGTSTNQTQTASFYSFMAHYDWHPAGSFTWNVEVGYQQQAGLGYDQNLFAARTYFNWNVGKLEFHLGCEHNNQDYVIETSERDFVFLRMRRNF